MEYLHLVERLQQIQDFENRSVGVLMRHAEREPIVDGKDAHLAQLTPHGRESARALGQQLSGMPIQTAYSSIIQRCADTGNLLLSGAGSTQKTVPDKMLSSGYIDDWERAKMEFAKRDPAQIILDYLNGDPISGFGTIADGSRRLLQFMRQRMATGRITLFITHDALVMPFLQHFCGVSFSSENWFPVLGAVLVTATDMDVQINGKKIEEQDHA